jgi:hypothetical protein
MYGFWFVGADNSPHVCGPGGHKQHLSPAYVARKFLGNQSIEVLPFLLFLTYSDARWKIYSVYNIKCF